MDEQTSDLFRRSKELLEISRQAHQEADRIRLRLQLLEYENKDILKRSELRIKESMKIVESFFVRGRQKSQS